MYYKTELHCHTMDVSMCANHPIENLVADYINSGYSTLVITDHFSAITFEQVKNFTWKQKCNFFMSGYENVKKTSLGRLNILLGMEYRNIYDNNDYLVFGVEPEFIEKYNVSDSDNLMLLPLEEAISVMHENGMLVYQAHPFRTTMKIVNPGIFDGIEVYNGNKRNDSRNDIAQMWAQKFNLATCSGSDFHCAEDLARGGIITDFEIKTNQDLLRALISNPQLIKPEENMA